ncbi:MAG: type II secretion system protein J [Acidimicrobiia bacterium]
MTAFASLMRLLSRIVKHRRPEGDQGTTMVEMMVAAALFLAVSFAMLDVMDSFTRTNSKLEQVGKTQRDLQEAVEMMSRDLRGATTLTTLASSVTYANQIDLVALSLDGTTSLPVRWRLGSGQLLREPLASAGGSATSSRTVMTGLSSSASLLRYFRSDGTELVPGTATASAIATCTTRIRITIAKSPGTNRPATSVSTDIAIRNRIPGTLGC